MGDRGRLVIPADVRERAHLHTGQPLVLLEAPGGLVVMTRDALRDRVRAELGGADLVGALLDERRHQAEAEEQP